MLYNKYDILRHNLAFFATRHIAKNEELTFDYIERDDDEDPEPLGTQDENSEVCYCGAAKCRGSVWL